VAPDDLTAQVSEADGYVLLCLRGKLTADTVPAARMLLRKLLLDRGRVLVDVTDLHPVWPSAVAIFPATLSAVGGWPWARLVLFGIVARGVPLPPWPGIGQNVPLAQTRARAEVMLYSRPERVSRRSLMPSTPNAGRLARSLVTEVCEDWDQDDLVDRAALVATELVSNAVEHARTPSIMALTLDRLGLHISVRDRQPMGEDDSAKFSDRSKGSRGLLLVAGLSRSWGVTRHEDGKSVWAVLGGGQDQP
jgi:anti-sigma regulatory factor (Ser/Thr protein kinase)